MSSEDKLIYSEITTAGFVIKDALTPFQTILFHRPTSEISFGHFTHPAGDFGGRVINSFFSFIMPLNYQPNQLWDAGEGHIRRSNARAGDCFIYLPDRPTYIGTERPIEFVCLFLNPAYLHSMVHKSIFSDRIEVSGQGCLHDPLFSGVLNTLHRGYQKHGKLDRLYVESLVMALCYHTLANYTTRQPIVTSLDERGLSKALLNQTLAYIGDHLSEDLGLDEIAASVHLSPFHFSRLFKQSTGQTPRQYVIGQRVEKAKSLLTRSRMSVGEVAQEVGFYDHAHLIRHFKRTVGVTPGDFRR